MKPFIQVGKWILALICGYTGVVLSFTLMSTKSTIENVGGFALLVATGVYIYIIIKNTFKNKNNGNITSNN